MRRGYDTRIPKEERKKKKKGVVSQFYVHYVHNSFLSVWLRSCCKINNQKRIEALGGTLTGYIIPGVFR